MVVIQPIGADAGHERARAAAIRFAGAIRVTKGTMRAVLTAIWSIALAWSVKVRRGPRSAAIRAIGADAGGARDGAGQRAAAIGGA